MTTDKANLPAFVLVDDDDDDRLLMRLALKETNSQFPVVELTNGAELLQYLHEDLSRYDDNRIHWLIIMDINMPVLSGPDALRQMQQHPLWKHVPVMMMSTSDEPRLAEEMQALGAITYVVKPKTYVELVNKIKTTFDPWMQQRLAETTSESTKQTNV